MTATPSPTLYGISNCDTVHKARKWLEQAQIPYQFHDFRQQGLSLDTLQHWLQQRDLSELVNRRSTTWRQLSEEEKKQLLEDQALSLLIEHPTLIKRPVLEDPTTQTLLIGFKEADYQQWQQLYTQSLHPQS